jgi:hypothetical protein
MSRSRGKALTPKYPPVYRLYADVVRPRRVFVLREDLDGLVHFALDEASDKANAVPWCFSKTGARLVIFFRYDKGRQYEMPTCLWCLNEPYKLSRRPL